MQISSRFTIAVHIFACIDTFQKDHKITSDFLAASVNVNPVIIRKILGQLKQHNLISVQRGTGGCTITKPLNEISFLDIYQAVECIDDEGLFHFHENPNQNCPVGKNIHNVLDYRLEQAQKALEEQLKNITLVEVMKDTQKYIQTGA